MEYISVNVSEDAVSSQLCVSQNSLLEKEIIINVVYGEGTAKGENIIIFIEWQLFLWYPSADGEDFLSDDSVLLVFNHEVNRSCFNITILNDNRNEPIESFFVNLTTSDHQVYLENDSTEVTIVDDDGIG